jgi:hypothetical protein
MTLVLLGWPGVSGAQQIQRNSDRPTLVLTAAMKAALQSFDPEFKVRTLQQYPEFLWRRPCRPMPSCAEQLYRITGRQAPFAVVGDFNGDRILDVVVDGDNAKGGRRIALLSRGREFVPSELGASLPRVSSDGPFDYWLLLVRPGKHDSGYEDAPLILKTDAFLDVYNEKGASIHYFRDGDWHVYTVSD